MKLGVAELGMIDRGYLAGGVHALNFNLLSHHFKLLDC